MLNHFEVKRLETALINWIDKFNQVSNELEYAHAILTLKMNDYQLKVNKSFTKVYYKRVSKKEREHLLQEAESVGIKHHVQAWFDHADQLESYGPLNALATLRIYYRKMVDLRRDFAQKKEGIKKLFAELKEIDMKAREFSEQGSSGTLFNIQANILAFQNRTKELIDLALEDDSDYMLNIHGLFVEGRTLKRDDLLQVITLKKQGKYWDGERFERFCEQYVGVPEEIDLKSFEELIFIEKIEHPDDCYLFDIFTNHVFNVMDSYEEETGQKAIDPVEVLEQITGKPLQTYSAEFDEYGDVVSLTPNKPSLKNVGGTDKA
jgi:hypothetical protein